MSLRTRIGHDSTYSDTVCPRDPARGGARGSGDSAHALLYSLIESAKLCGVEPRAYLGEAAGRAVRNPGTVTLARDLKSPEA